MDGIVASWAVEYADGSQLTQYDAEGKEVPYRTIDWTRVAKLSFESQLLRQTFNISKQPGEHLSLRSRHFLTLDGTSTMCFILLSSRPGEEVGPESTNWALYWFPDGSLHECAEFDCSEVRQYGCGLVHDQDHGLMPRHARHEVSVDAQVQ